MDLIYIVAKHFACEYCFRQFRQLRKTILILLLLTCILKTWGGGVEFKSLFTTQMKPEKQSYCLRFLFNTYFYYESMAKSETKQNRKTWWMFTNYTSFISS